MRTSTRHNRHKALNHPIAGQKDLVRVAPNRATWKCGCGYTNVIYFKREIAIGHVFPERMRCLSCPLEYRGRFIITPAVVQPESLVYTPLTPKQM